MDLCAIPLIPAPAVGIVRRYYCRLGGIDDLTLDTGSFHLEIATILWFNNLLPRFYSAFCHSVSSTPNLNADWSLGSDCAAGRPITGRTCVCTLFCKMPFTTLLLVGCALIVNAAPMIIHPELITRTMGAEYRAGHLRTHQVA